MILDLETQSFACDYSELYMPGYSCKDVEELFRLYCIKKGLFTLKLPDHAKAVKHILIEFFNGEDLETSLLTETGVPDFFVTDKEEFMFVETKSESDSMRTSQIKWFQNYKEFRTLLLIIYEKERPPDKKSIDEIMAETTAQRRAYGRIIRNSIDTLINDDDVDTKNGVHIIDLKRVAYSQGIQLNDLEETITKMLNVGEMYEVSHEYYRMTR